MPTTTTTTTKRINFSRNWNGKIDNYIFTTIRKENYSVTTNDVCDIYINDLFKKQVIVLHCEIMPYADLNWVTLALDTGYLLGGAQKIFENLGVKPGDNVKILVLKTL